MKEKRLLTDSETDGKLLVLSIQVPSLDMVLVYWGVLKITDKNVVSTCEESWNTSKKIIQKTA